MNSILKRRLALICLLFGLLLLCMNARYLSPVSTTRSHDSLRVKNDIAKWVERPTNNETNLSECARSNAIDVISPKQIDRQHPINVDLVVALSGEFGNHILKIAYGKIIQLMALEDGRFNFTVRYLSQGIPRSDRARADVHQCFTKHFAPDKVNLTEWRANSQQWNDTWNNQVNFVSQLYSDWNDPSLAGKMLKLSNIAATFNHLEDVTTRMASSQGRLVGANLYSSRSFSSMRSGPSMPFVLATSYAPWVLIDKYYNELQELFSFNESACCNTRPGKDETVLHLRGFSIELSGAARERMDFQELDPDRTSHELLCHLQRGSKVAVVSRFGEEVMQPYIDSMTKRGILARAVTGQTGVQDFCFLKSATKGLVGTWKSTYLKTAAVLSDTVRNVTLYSLSKSAESSPSNATMFRNEQMKLKNFTYPKFQHIKVAL